MRRFLSCLTIFVLLAVCLPAARAEGFDAAQVGVGSTVFFGRYEQDKNPDNGEEPIEWVVLAVQEGKALLLSRFALDCLPFQEGEEPASWAESSIRAWLNDAFLGSAFTGAERQAILTASVPNDPAQGNPEWEETEAEATQDSVFLLSYGELSGYLPDADSRKVAGTEYARGNGAKFLGITALGISETDWWTRSPGKGENNVCYLDIYGKFMSRKGTGKLGVRPALWLDLTVDQGEFPYSRFAEASKLQEEGQYTAAADIYETLENYWDSAALAKECRYLNAMAVMESGDVDAALPLFEALDGYKDSYLQGRAARYHQAVAYQEAGDYETAARLFGEVGQYEDSMARMKQCFDKLGVSVFYFSADPVNTGVDNGYSRTDAIGGSDIHFGWRLGRFFMSGFTRVSGGDTDQPVFIKTLGDDVTLWFDLEQDIDALNGNANLVIADDSNGYDQAFGVQRTDFGRGALVIRHTDYQNAKGDPVLYTDYLLAKGTSGANTRVVLKEEGDYEVALNYETSDNALAHVMNKFGNYRIAFRFSVRNGNCMVYPFDVLTRAELQNTSVTENGFYLDLARSRYLDINVRRSVLVQSAAGMVEDERFNRPAKDGDEYTQEGIYTISVSNRYTGESTTKTLFVGSEDLLAEYIANGFSMDRLK